MKQILLVVISLCCLQLPAQKLYPPLVAKVIAKAGKNKSQLKEALDHFYKDGDSLKIKAIEFLIANMDIHSSYDYYWADNNGKRIFFNEFSYASFPEALKAFDTIKIKHPGLHAVAIHYRDIDTIKAGYLINNVNAAFEAWRNPWIKKLSFNQFCEYLLPYRASVEPLQDWRKTYQTRYAWIGDSAQKKSIKDILQLFAAEQRLWFTNTYELNTRQEPLPRLGALQLLHRKTGSCEDVADLMVFALRSQGIMVANDMVTYWATSTGSHFFNNTLNDSLQPMRFDASSPTSVRFTSFDREPAKVIRTTYSKQPNTASMWEAAENIPDCFLRTLNYIDVTNEYWPTKDVSVKVFENAKKPKLAFVAVLNGLKWKATWWGKVKNDSVTFTNMCKGAVFLPMYFMDNKLIPAGFPVASGYNNTIVLQPDTLHKRTIEIKQQDKYLFFRSGKKYKLFYWNNAWKLLQEQKAEEGITKMVFDNVPNNALLLLVPEYSQHKERPFIILANNERVWW